MKLIRKLTPYLVLLLLVLSQVVESSRYTNFATRRARRALSRFEAGNRFIASNRFMTSLDENNALTVWEAFKAAKFMDYIDIIAGFLGAYWPDFAGVWGATRKSAAFLPFMEAIKKTCYDNLSSFLLTDTNPASAEEVQLTSGASKLFSKVETSSDANNCAELAKAGTPCAPGEKPAKQGGNMFFTKVMSFWEGFKKFKACWIQTYEQTKAQLGDPFKPLFTFLKKFLSLFTVTGAIKGIVAAFWGKVTQVAKLGINILRFFVTLYNAVKQWKTQNKINFMAIGMLFGLIVKTVTDAMGVSPVFPSVHQLVTKRRRRLMKKYY